MTWVLLMAVVKPYDASWRSCDTWSGDINIRICRNEVYVPVSFREVSRWAPMEDDAGTPGYIPLALPYVSYLAYNTVAMDVIRGDGEDYIIREIYVNDESLFEAFYDFLRDVSAGDESNDEDVSQSSASSGRGIETPSQGGLFCFLKTITKHKRVVAQD